MPKLAPDVATLAAFLAAESGDWQTAEAIITHPDEFAHVGGNSDRFAAFVDKFAGEPPGPPPRPGLKWKGETSRWVSAETGQDHPEQDGPHAGLADEIANDLPPGMWDKVKDKALTAAAVVYQKLLNVTPALHKVLTLLPDVLDEPKDLSRLGYNPSMLGTHHATADPTKDALGISTHTATVIASHVLGRAFVWAKRRLGIPPQQFADDAELLTQGVKEFAALLAEVNKALGLNVTITEDQIRAALTQRQTTPAEPVKLAAEPSAQMGDGKPASKEVALAGKDGAALAKIIKDAKDMGAATMANITREAVRRYEGHGPLMNRQEINRLAEAIASVNSTANLLGRSRVREMAERVDKFGAGLSKFAATDIPLQKFADAAPVLRTPEEAAEYFQGLAPTLGTDPLRLIGAQRRLAFTLAASANQVLTRRVQQAVAEGLRENEATADVTARIADALDRFGATHRNPQYAEMVFRTNAADAFQTGMYEEGRANDLAEVFPVWEYLGIRDGRQGEDHEPHFGRYYPRTATFAAVRGDRPYNCRCSLRWVDGYDWNDLLESGQRIETKW